MVQTSLAACADYPIGYDYNPEISLDESKWLPEPVKTILRALCLDPVFNCRDVGTQNKLTDLRTVLRAVLD